MEELSRLWRQDRKTSRFRESVFLQRANWFFVEWTKLLVHFVAEVIETRKVANNRMNVLKATQSYEHSERGKRIIDGSSR